MIRTLSLALLLSTALAAPALAAPSPQELAGWKKQAARVTITRDDFGIAHVRGKTDADAVFGMMFAQGEDDFNRVETNFINAQGRLAEAEGEKAIWQDLRMKLFIQPEALKADYAASPAWLKALMNAWADGLNYYLATHPQVKPRVITRFEPWMALSFSEGSIGGDIESISLGQLERFYGGKGTMVAALTPEERGIVPVEPAGSNGFAIAPANTKNGKALLVINPHTSFFFRSEAQVTSGEGLNVYGASTWGQFFTYQGFNSKAGWMHTSSGVDVIDEFAVTVETRNGVPGHSFGGNWEPLQKTDITIPYRTAAGGMANRTITTFRTRHGPVVRSEGGQWIAVALMHKPLAALQQSWLRTKTSDLASYLKVAELKANSSNATLFASHKGEIAYLHPQFVPVRDARFDYTRPVDGSDPATAWKGEHKVSELPNVLNPKSGWAMNTNNWPWTAAGADSPRQADYPAYMDSAGENPRGPNAVRVLTARKDFTPETLLEAAYDPYLPAFAELVPTLLAAYDRLPAGDARKAGLAGPIAALRGWDFRSGEESVPAALATRWGEALMAKFGEAARANREALVPYLMTAPADTARLAALTEAADGLARDFGTWETPFGKINRYQRINGELVQPFSDDKPSIPVGFSSATWGSLASFGVRGVRTTKAGYGSYGNSFVAVVEFGPSVNARAISAGGQSGDPASPHFGDQAQRYASHDFRSVYFTPDALKGHTERVYRPGE